MKRNSGLQKRWLRNTLSILFAIVLLCVIALSIMVAAYYYSSMEARDGGQSAHEHELFRQLRPPELQRILPVLRKIRPEL